MDKQKPETSSSGPRSEPTGSPADAPVAWIDGCPPHPYDKEWFIALSLAGTKVVLRALPEEYSYDYTTADQTYWKANSIKRWMQFPDSEFIPYKLAAPSPSDVRKDAALKLTEWFNETNFADTAELRGAYQAVQAMNAIAAEAKKEG